MTWPELVATLEAAGVDTADPIRLAHIAMHIELTGVLCSGPSREGHSTYALLSERVRTVRTVIDNEARDELALRYFTTRGPATVRDFAWWSGMTLGTVRAAIAALGDQLTRQTCMDVEYWAGAEQKAPSVVASDGVLLLPAYDEYLVSYADRGAVLHPHASTPQGRRNPVFDRTIVDDGVVVGTWSIDRRTGSVEPDFFGPPGAVRRRAFAAAADRYQDFSRT
jgi:hypothetical protein